MYTKSIGRRMCCSPRHVTLFLFSTQSLLRLLPRVLTPHAVYIISKGSSTNEFYRLVRKAYEKDGESSVVLCSKILAADLDDFVLMMKHTKESLLLVELLYATVAGD
ncbi:hypothetical protein PybrP1_001392 [[Pythium] brassicae (nom. inval.)]|nr:hypothetical protein PybrP1_001392 [[Pythium] brassicae (nom. inval.)]